MRRTDRFDYDVFVGYPGKDVGHANAAAEALRKIGLRVFIDVDLLPGSVFSSAIPDALERARVFVYLVSLRSVDGWYDKGEAARAVSLHRTDGRRRRLVPLRLGEKTDKPYGLENIVDIVTADPPTESDLARMAELLKRVVDDARSHDPAPEMPPADALTPRDPPPLPRFSRPYPLLDPYTHPALFAGRDHDRDALVARLRDPVGHPVILLHAPSGAGKSSLLKAGVLPALRGQLDEHEPAPVALVELPHQPRLTDALMAQLVEGAAPVDDQNPVAIAEAFAAVPGGPICVLDQFEEVFAAADPAARARVGLALAATVLGTRRVVRWVLAYRDDFHGRVTRWLGDVLVDARAAKWPTSGLRFDLATARAVADVPLALFGDPIGGEDPRSAARRAFAEAIERPLRAPGATWGWRVEPKTRDALADAFAAARVDDTDRRAATGDPDAAPLVPELQVVLARLMDRAGDDHLLCLESEDPRAAADALIGNALRDHLCDALDEAVRTWRRRDAARAWHHILLALRRLTAGRRRGPAVAHAELAAVIGDNGDAVLDRLADPDRRLIITEAADDPDDRRTRYHRLSHDRLAEAIAAEVADRLEAAADDDPLALEDFVETASASFARGNPDMAELSRSRRRALARLPAAVREADEARQTWWRAVRAHGRRQRRTWSIIGVLGALALAALALLVARELREGEIDGQIASTDPATNWRGLARRVAGGASPADAVRGLPDAMDWDHRRGLLAEVFVEPRAALRRRRARARSVGCRRRIRTSGRPPAGSGATRARSARRRRARRSAVAGRPSPPVGPRRGRTGRRRRPGGACDRPPPAACRSLRGRPPGARSGRPALRAPRTRRRARGRRGTLRPGGLGRACAPACSALRPAAAGTGGRP